MRRVLLDSNALDPLLTKFGAFEALDQAVSSASLEVLYTHITVDEIAATPNLETRQWLLNLLVFLGRPILTSGAVADFSRANFCRVMADLRILTCKRQVSGSNPLTGSPSVSAK